MRLTRFTILSTLLLIQAARAQDNETIAVPPAPPMVATPTVIPPPPATPPSIPAPPGLVVTPVPPLNDDTGSGSSADTGTASVLAAPAAPAPSANSWLPGATVKLGVLDKIDGTVSEIAIAAGAAATIGDLSIAVQSCVTRPPDQIPDAAVFLTAQNPQDPTGAPLYRGWMVRSIPGATVVGDASETFRIISCF